MRVLVVLAILGVCVAKPFTPAVLQATKVHQQLFNQAAAAAAAAPDDDAYGHQAYRSPHHQQAPVQHQYGHVQHHHVPVQQHHTGPIQKWTGPLASQVPAGVDGNITPVGDTAEVSAAKSEFFSNYQNALAGRPVATHQAPQHHAGHRFSPAPQQQHWRNVATSPEELAAATNSFLNTYQAAYSAAAGAIQG